MYQMAKSAREKMKAKARALAAPGTLKGGQDTTQADWSPAEPLNADVKTGARPVGKGARLYNKGGKVNASGKVSGAAVKARADRKPRKSGGRTVEKEIGIGMANKDVRAANEQREGLKHVGAFKKGGKAKRATGGSVPSDKETQTNKERVGTIKVKPTRGAAQHYDKGGKIGKDEGGIVSKLNRLTGYKSPSQKLEEGLSGVGKGRTSSYSSSDKSALSDIAKGGSGSTLPSDETEFGKSQNYKKGGKAGGKWIQKAIEKPGALRKSLGVKEGEKIPAKKLEAASEKGGKLGKRARLAQTLGRLGKATGGGLMGMLKGGKKTTKKAGKTDINIVINAGKSPARHPAAGLMPPPGGDAGAPPMPPMPPIGAGAPAMPPMPPGGPAMPPAGAPPLPGRKAGGRISKVAKSYKDMEAGAASGEGRLQKTDIESRHTDAPARKSGGRISKVAKSYKDMTAGAGDGEGRLQKTDIAKAKKARGK